MIRLFFILCYKLTGWKVKGQTPEEKKYVLIVAPHTSFWDFPVGIAAKSILRLKGRFLAKGELFRNPIVGFVLRKMGGCPVDRTKHTNMVDTVVDIFAAHEELAIVITPEGTREYVPKWKSGFYYISQKANVPIVMCGFDFKRKFVELREPFYPSGSFEEDLEFMLSYFRTIQGKHPELGVH